MMPFWWGAVLAVSAGAVMPLAFAPFDLYPLAVLSLSLLFWLWRQATARVAFCWGALFGLGMFGTGVNWVYISIHEFGHVPLLLSVFLTILFVAVLSLFPALAAYLGVRLLSGPTQAHHHYRMVWLFPSLWVLSEWVRGWFLTGFPWLNVGYSQMDAPLSGFAPLLGVYGVSLGVAVSAVLLLAAFADRGGLVRGVYLVAVVGLWGLAVVLGRLEWTQQTGQTLRVSLIQGNISQDMKWHPAMLRPTLDLYVKLTREHWDSDLVIWPETAIPLFSYQARSFLDMLAAEARYNDTDLLLGLVYQQAPGAPYYNSMLGLSEQQPLYSKRHLVPFTEYLPMKPVFAGLIDILDVPMSSFSAGSDKPRPLLLAGQWIGVSICYEDAFGEEMIDLLPQASLLVNTSNDAWFAGSIAPAQHLQMAQMRALESGRELLRATNTGITAVIDAHGRIRAALPQFETDVLTAEVQARRGATPYVQAGNLPLLVLLVTMLLVGRFIRRYDA